MQNSKESMHFYIRAERVKRLQVTPPPIVSRLISCIFPCLTLTAYFYMEFALVLFASFD